MTIISTLEVRTEMQSGGNNHRPLRSRMLIAQAVLFVTTLMLKWQYRILIDIKKI